MTFLNQIDVVETIKKSGFSRCQWQRLTGINRKRLKRIEDGEALVTPDERHKIIMAVSSTRLFLRGLLEALGLTDEISDDKWRYIEELADNLPKLFWGLARLESPIELVPPKQVIDFVVRKVDERSQEIAQRRDAEWR